MPATKVGAKNSKSADPQFASRSTRLLLALWGWEEPTIPKGKLTERLKRKGEKAADYKDVFAQLEDQGAIEIESGSVKILSPGVELLGKHLKNSDLMIEGTIVGAWVAKALYKWIQKEKVMANSLSNNGKASASTIASYEEFKQVALDVFDRLNSNYNMGNMVPIYRIRREIGDQISRTQFNEWLLVLQSDDILQLLEESVEDSAPDKIEDSVTTKLGKLRCYAKRTAA
jgi:hypothetical protein